MFLIAKTFSSTCFVALIIRASTHCKDHKNWFWLEWVNAVERLCDSCQWGSITVCMPSLATITQPQYSVNSLILTHSNLQVSWCYICLYFAKRDFIPNIWKFWLGLIISGKNWYVRNKFPTCDASTSFGQPQWPWKWPSQFHLFNFTLQNVVENWNYFLQANFS